ncbi:phosphoglycerate mutase [Coriobacterium glomerans PW2]|uniref:2,3-bisphosphoglycerate-dependent phosphoglycerate mutase n=1 Tax=Coriobacterium glomerans (strain ATCC 49209 / DSM 20642 / JCM 10262 / PW2) TaxID=700015 RepID=F2N7F9_CORGP|nr:2,3-diphosphoglycerate-dependent phosphoglycerate mutase [Coriobacterium glomerans]AEB06775.1 phosphoglycerate mutase [Coriobacterium glomerans PW2]
MSAESDSIMRLVLIRHGESAWNRLNLFTGWTDVDLTDTGRQEAADGGRALRREGLDFDICYTSYLKRAIRTLNIVLEELDREWLPVTKSWKLNERHYGALQGLNKTETAQKYGEDQVKIWRRSFDVRPPALDAGDERDPHGMAMYREVNADELPLSEALSDTIARAWPYFQKRILPEMRSGRRVLIAAHGNSLRALVKQFDHLGDDEIAGVNIPTGIPLVYEFDAQMNVTDKRYLGDPAAIEAKMNAVADQGKASRPA